MSTGISTIVPLAVGPQTVIPSQPAFSTLGTSGPAVPYVSPFSLGQPPTVALNAATIGAPANQTVGSGVSSANQNITLSAVPTIDNTLVLFYGRSGGTATGKVSSVTDAGGNTWWFGGVGSVAGVANTRMEVWYCRVTANPGTILVNSGTAQTNSWNVVEWAGLDVLAPLDENSPPDTGTTSSTSIKAPDIPARGPADLVVTCAHFGQTTTGSLTAGWTALTNFDDAAVGSGRAAYQVQTINGLVTGPTWGSLGVAKQAGVVTISFYAANAGPPTGAVAMNGAGSLAVAGNVVESGTVTMASAGDLAVAGTSTSAGQSGAVAMSGAGSLAVAGIVTESGTVAMAGAGTLAVAGLETHTATVAMDGAGTTTVAALITHSYAVAMAGAGVLAVAGLETHTGVVAMAGAGTTAIVGLQTITGLVSLAGASVMAIGGSQSQSGTVSMPGSGVLAVVPAGGLQTGSVALAGAGVLAISALVTHGYAVAMAGAGTLAISSVLITHSSVVAMAGSGAVSITGFKALTASLLMDGLGTLAVTPLVTHSGSVPMVGSGALAILNQQSVIGLVSLNGSGSMNVAGVVLPFVTGSLSMVGAGVLLIAGVIQSLIQAAVPMAGHGTFAVVAVLIPSGKVVISWNDFHGGPSIPDIERTAPPMAYPDRGITIPDLIHVGTPTPYHDWGIPGGRSDT